MVLSLVSLGMRPRCLRALTVLAGPPRDEVLLPPDARPFRDAFVYGAVIAMLIWRPNGLFASKAAKQRV